VDGEGERLTRRVTSAAFRLRESLDTFSPFGAFAPDGFRPVIPDHPTTSRKLYHGVCSVLPERSTSAVPLAGYVALVGLAAG
jgi:hypothetical protein